MIRENFHVLRPQVHCSRASRRTTLNLRKSATATKQRTCIIQAPSAQAVSSCLLRLLFSVFVSQLPVYFQQALYFQYTSYFLCLCLNSQYTLFVSQLPVYFQHFQALSLPGNREATLPREPPPPKCWRHLVVDPKSSFRSSVVRCHIASQCRCRRLQCCFLICLLALPGIVASLTFTKLFDKREAQNYSNVFF